MNEAGRCDRISLMNAGKVLVTDMPAELVAKRAAADAGSGLHRLPGGRRRWRRHIEPTKARAEGAGIRTGRASLPRVRANRCFSLSTCLELQSARGAGTQARSGAGHDGPAGHGHSDVHLRLRHQPGCGEAEIRGAGPRPDHVKPGLCAQPLRFAILRRASADRRLCRTRSADAFRRARAGRRDPTRLRAGCGSRRPGADRRLGGRFHAAARRNGARLCTRHASRLAPGRSETPLRPEPRQSGHDRYALSL